MASWDDVVRGAAGLPGLEEATTYGRAPALKVRGKIVCWMRDRPEALMVRVESLAEKEALLADPRGIFFTTDHYDGHASVLVRIEDAPIAEVLELVEDAWRLVAPAKVVAELDATSPRGADAADA